jgi:hypothetical protein
MFLPGGGTVGLDYWNVQQRAAELTTSVLYDRAGTGWSDRRVELPRTSAEVTDELRNLLRIADVPAPTCWSATPWEDCMLATTRPGFPRR